MNESHAGLRDDYEVSGPALDAMVEAAPCRAGMRRGSDDRRRVRRMRRRAGGRGRRWTTSWSARSTAFRTGGHEGPAGAAAYPSAPSAGASLERM